MGFCESVHHFIRSISDQRGGIVYLQDAAVCLAVPLIVVALNFTLFILGPSVQYKPANDNLVPFFWWYVIMLLMWSGACALISFAVHETRFPSDEEIPLLASNKVPNIVPNYSVYQNLDSPKDNESTVELVSDSAAIPQAAGSTSKPVEAAVHDHRLDNVKYFLTQVVFLSHAIPPFFFCMDDGYKFLWSILSWKEAFLMQAYAFMSGYLSTGSPNAIRMNRLYSKIAFGYVLCQLLFQLWVNLLTYDLSSTWLTESCTTYSFTYRATTDAHVFFHNILLSPFGHLWYLLSLVQWRFLGHYWMRFRWPVVTSVLLALLTEYCFFPSLDTEFLSMQKTIGYFPLYMFGFTVKSEKPIDSTLLRIFGRIEAKIAGWAALFLHLALQGYNYCSQGTGCRMFDTQTEDVDPIIRVPNYRSPTFWTATNPLTETYLAHPYYTDDALSYSWICSLSFYALWILMTLSLLATIPQGKMIFSDLGSRSMSNYVFHLFFLPIFSYMGVYDGNEGWRVWLCFFLCILVSHILMSKLFWDYFAKWILFPPLEFMLKSVPESRSSR